MNQATWVTAPATVQVHLFDTGSKRIIQTESLRGRERFSYIQISFNFLLLNICLLVCPRHMRRNCAHGFVLVRKKRKKVQFKMVSMCSGRPI